MHDIIRHISCVANFLYYRNYKIKIRLSIFHTSIPFFLQKLEEKFSYYHNYKIEIRLLFFHRKFLMEKTTLLESFFFSYEALNGKKTALLEK